MGQAVLEGEIPGGGDAGPGTGWYRHLALLHYSKRPDLDVKLGAARAWLPFEPSARIAWILSSIFRDRYPGKLFGDPNVRRRREPCRVIKRSCLDKGDCSIGGAMTVDMRAADTAVVALERLSARAAVVNVGPQCVTLDGETVLSHRYVHREG